MILTDLEDVKNCKKYRTKYAHMGKMTWHFQ
jgi:hypothetical protein